MKLYSRQNILEWTADKVVLCFLCVFCVGWAFVSLFRKDDNFTGDGM